MENAQTIQDPASDFVKVYEMRLGANWFFWIAALSVVNSLIVNFWPSVYTPFGLGATQSVGLAINQASSEMMRWLGLAFNLLFAAFFAMFGYFGRRGSDMAFIVGMFLYFMDALLVLSYRDIFAFAFHILALFFMFKGLLANRRRLDPSV